MPTKKKLSCIIVILITMTTLMTLVSCAGNPQISSSPDRSVTSQSPPLDNSVIDKIPEQTDANTPPVIETQNPNDAISEQPNAETPVVVTGKGSIKTFVYRDLILDVSNVKEIKRGSSFDGMTRWEYDIYVIYPGATVTIVNADMCAEGPPPHTPHADWAILTTDNESIDIVDAMEPLEIGENLQGIYDPESSVFVLTFELYPTSNDN